MSRSAAFAFLCDCLSIHSTAEFLDELASTARNPKFEWDQFVTVAGEQRVSGMVKSAFAQKNLLLILPTEIIDYFDGIAALCKLRNDEIYLQIIEITGQLNAIEVAPVFLKGAASLMLDLHPSREHRVMYDIDILVPQSRLMDSFQKLVGLSYTPATSLKDMPVYFHHLPSLGRRDKPAPVELHATPIAHPHKDLLKPIEVLEQARFMEIDGARFGVPKPKHMLIHTIAHCHIADRSFRHGFLDLQQIKECALIGNSQEDVLVWREVEKSFSKSAHHTAYAFQIRAMNALIGTTVELPMRSGWADALLFQRAVTQIRFPRFATVTSRLMHLCEAMIATISDSKLRRRLAKNIFNPYWLARHIKFLFTGTHQ